MIRRHSANDFPLMADIEGEKEEAGLAESFARLCASFGKASVLKWD